MRTRRYPERKPLEPFYMAFDPLQLGIFQENIKVMPHNIQQLWWRKAQKEIGILLPSSQCDRLYAEKDGQIFWTGLHIRKSNKQFLIKGTELVEVEGKFEIVD